MSRCTILALATIALWPGAVAAVTAGPVAVLPFKNLNADPESAWLSTGVAETMITDMKKSGLIKVVEREALDAALTEIALQGLSRTDPSTAAKVGKMVGAKAVVVGSFQRAGGKLRFVARMVDVETGLIAETAKVTGAAYQVFELQDQIVEQLLGIPPPPRRRARRSARKRPKARLAAAKRKKAKVRLEAYRLYAMSLTVASDADRVGWLQRSVKIDPDFAYALEDLAKLEARMVEYRRKHERHLSQKNEALRAKLEEEKDPMLRMQQAMALLTGDLTGYRYEALLVDAQTVYELTWERPENMPMWTSPREIAASYLVLGNMMLKRTSMALQLGERFLEDFPESMYFAGVEGQMRSMIEARKAIARGREELPAALLEIEADREAREERAKARGREIPPVFFVNLDLKRCSETISHRQYAETLEACGAFIEAHGRSDEKEIQDKVAIARFHRIRALSELGRFDDARARVRWMLEHDPEHARQYSLETIERTWPR